MATAAVVTACAAVYLKDLLTDFMFATASPQRQYEWTEEEASKMLQDMMQAIPTGATDAEELPPFILGPFILAADGPPVEGTSDQRRRHIMDGQQRLLTLCLLLAAARCRFLASGDSRYYGLAKQIKQLLAQNGDMVEGLPEQLRVQLATEEDTAFLCRLLLEPDCQPGEGELAGEARRNLSTNLQLFRQQLDGLSLPRLQLLVHFILSRVIVNVTTMPTISEALHLFLKRASLPELLKRGLSLQHLPDGSEELAATADVIITLDGSLLALHSFMLATHSRKLRQQLSAGGSAAAKAVAVQQAFEGHSLADVRLFLRLLYSVGSAATSVHDSSELRGVVKLAHELDAPAMIQACDERLCMMLVNRADWVDWLLLADRYGLEQLKPRAAKGTLWVMLQGRLWAPQERRDEDLRKLTALSPATLLMLFEGLLAAARTANRCAMYKGTKLEEYLPSQFSAWKKPGNFL
ncbi:hypothetical protein ABPG75_000108 [Micractinium tetrahymenae]